MCSVGKGRSVDKLKYLRTLILLEICRNLKA
jgi:hypothetical protein